MRRSYCSFCSTCWRYSSRTPSAFSIYSAIYLSASSSGYLLNCTPVIFLISRRSLLTSASFCYSIFNAFLAIILLSSSMTLSVQMLYSRWILMSLGLSIGKGFINKAVISESLLWRKSITFKVRFYKNPFVSFMPPLSVKSLFAKFRCSRLLLESENGSARCSAPSSPI